MFTVMLVVQLLLELLWPGLERAWLELVLLPVFIAAGWTLLNRSWLRVSTEGLRAGHGPFTRERVPVAEVLLAGTYRVRPRRPGDERLPGDTALYSGWGPRVLLERVDGSRVVVGVTDPGATLAALELAGVPVE